MSDVRLHEYRITATETRLDRVEPAVARHDREIAVLKAKLGLYVAFASGLGALLVHLIFGG